MSKISTDFGTDHELMTHTKNLQKTQSGIYFLRLQRNGKDRKISLKTKDLATAKLAVAILHATLASMIVNFDKIKGWSLETDGQNIKINTEDNDADRASALEAVKIFADKRTQEPESYKSVIQNRFTITLGEAISEYRPVLAKTDTAIKTQRMAESVLADLVKRLGAALNMALINDDIIEEKWLNPRLNAVAKTTAKRDLTFIRGFINWASDKKRKYTPAPLTLTVEAKSENWSYLNASDLKLIFDNLPRHVQEPWQLYIPIIALYTGARISEIASLKVEDFIEKTGIKAMRLRGTKTDASDRTIPLHADLVALGLLEYVSTRRDKANLFEIAHHDQNGAGATASKWYTKFKKSIGVKDPLKVFHSFRPTIVDHLKQAGSGFEARCQYLGHDSGGGVHNKVYGRNELNLTIIKNEVVDKIDWQKYCGWEPNIEALKTAATYT